MAGFFGLFGRKTKNVDDPTDYSQEPVKEEAFFLSPDEAKTLGNIDFMRQSNTIERTFPKTLNSKGQSKRIVKSISSLEEKKVDGVAIQPKSISNDNGNQNGSTPKTERRSGDANLDMFRKMAKDIKK